MYFCFSLAFILSTGKETRQRKGLLLISSLFITESCGKRDRAKEREIFLFFSFNSICAFVLPPSAFDFYFYFSFKEEKQKRRVIAVGRSRLVLPSLHHAGLMKTS